MTEQQIRMAIDEAIQLGEDLATSTAHAEDPQEKKRLEGEVEKIRKDIEELSKDLKP